MKIMVSFRLSRSLGGLIFGFNQEKYDKMMEIVTMEELVPENQRSERE
ncbi:hypothetical protein MUN89_12510 [Halobacillus salinarum]|uniref:Uncharacterized protein n=1 Tax=Halobacillus salinarum TaxID=2932257 RepID=A0ABY4EE97_9BACI|nr:hypothetical protein [Halobacillus salinarum]UOQ42788.1 hypothetical protein MUN89_12510 [Halobacillus salinarum]